MGSMPNLCDRGDRPGSWGLELQWRRSSNGRSSPR